MKCPQKMPIFFFFCFWSRKCWFVRSHVLFLQGILHKNYWNLFFYFKTNHRIDWFNRFDYSDFGCCYFSVTTISLWIHTVCYEQDYGESMWMRTGLDLDWLHIRWVERVTVSSYWIEFYSVFTVLLLTYHLKHMPTFGLYKSALLLVPFIQPDCSMLWFRTVCNGYLVQ